MLSNDDVEDDSDIGVDGFERSSNVNGLYVSFILYILDDSEDVGVLFSSAVFSLQHLHIQQ